MERTRLVRNLRIAAALLCLAACAFLIAIWYRSYNCFDVIRVPLPGSHGLQIISSDGRLQLIEYRPSIPVRWQWSRVTLQALNNEPVMLQLKKRYQMLLMSLARQLAEQRPTDSSRDLEAQLELTKRDFEDFLEELKQRLLRTWPIAPNTSSPSSINIGPMAKIHFGFSYQSSSSGAILGVPFWFLVLLSGACAALIGVRWRLRFSLRTMLIATTLAAIALGIVTAMKH